MNDFEGATNVSLDASAESRRRQSSTTYEFTSSSTASPFWPKRLSLSQHALQSQAENYPTRFQCDIEVEFGFALFALVEDDGVVV